MVEVDEAFVRRAARQADANALRVALFQHTGAEQLAAMEVVRRPIRGGGMFALTLNADDRDRVADHLVAFSKLRPPSALKPSAFEVKRLLDLFGAPAQSLIALTQAIEDLAFDPAARDVYWSGTTPNADLLQKWPIAIVGAGISGLAAAIKLKKLGLPFVIYDRQTSLGGTWALNAYPHARVDIPNSVYQFKFERLHDWESNFSSQRELQAYLAAVADRHALGPHLRLGIDVAGASWDEAQARWCLRLRATDGTITTAHSRVVLSASGLFGTPRRPDIQGIDRFAGPIMHTTGWREQPLAGKRIALIGTGSSGAQLMPHLAHEAATLDVYQRTPNWVMPMKGYAARRTPEQRWIGDAVPAYWHWQLYSALLLDREIEVLQEEDRAWQEQGGAVSPRNDALRAYLVSQVQDRFAHRPDLQAASIPSYPPGARRMVVDNGWYDALLRDNVRLISDPIAQIEEDEIITSDGARRPVDVLVLGTGFETDRYLWPAGYVGRNGATPETLWQSDGPRAHLGMSLPGMPNFVLMYGPHGQPRSGAFHDWAERWARYALRLVIATIEGGFASFEVKRQAFDRYNAELNAAGEGLIWGTRGAGSYYRDATGRPAVNMPWRSASYFERILEPDLSDFDLRN